MAKDTAKGLAFLHGSDPPTLHNDLKSSNLLVSHNWICKVSDFGLTSLKGSRTQVCLPLFHFLYFVFILLNSYCIVG